MVALWAQKKKTKKKNQEGQAGPAFGLAGDPLLAQKGRNRS